MTIRPVLIAAVRHLRREVAAERAARQQSPQPSQSPQPRAAGPMDRFEPPQGTRAPQQNTRGLANADSGGGDPKGGTQIGW